LLDEQEKGLLRRLRAALTEYGSANLVPAQDDTNDEGQKFDIRFELYRALPTFRAAF